MGFKEKYGVFTEQTTTEHVTMLTGSIVLAHSIYIISVMLMGGIEALTEESTAAMYTRRNGMIAISIGTTLYFSVAYMQAIGGEFLNFLYNLLVIIVTPHTATSIFGTPPMNLYTEGLYQGYLSDVLPIVVFPCVVTPVIVFFVWPRSFEWRETSTTYEEWYEENVPEWDEENALDQGNNQS